MRKGNYELNVSKDTQSRTTLICYIMTFIVNYKQRWPAFSPKNTAETYRNMYLSVSDCMCLSSHGCMSEFMNAFMCSFLCFVTYHIIVWLYSNQVIHFLLFCSCLIWYVFSVRHVNLVSTLDLGPAYRLYCFCCFWMTSLCLELTSLYYFWETIGFEPSL